MNTQADFDKFNDRNVRDILKKLDDYRALLLDAKDIGVPKLTAMVDAWILNIKSNTTIDEQERTKRLELLKYAIETVSEFDQDNNLKIMGGNVLHQWDFKTKKFKIDF